ncbi:hypothetical protein FA13DRAFT_1736544 [Coprinellus micaceus]|uniref:BTB domain-containing protein n=1 Tax=Coprinellus micaceus TaxID=71717 RepID=A0A4Y7SZY5_COPMI|nr:hypothetical protein FA13DRAFT_1736544 [Coprinellus micaceus]
MSESLDNQISYHPEFCFGDGSIVLLVEGTVGFKVHKSLLCRHSTFFKDMLGLPLKDSETTRLGQPVVRLPQDNAAGVAGVLKAVYDNRFFDKYLPTVLSSQGEQQYLGLLSAMMPVARKYDFESVFDGCIEALRRILPIQFQGMTTRIESLQLVVDPVKRTANILTALRLADTFDLFEFFPSLFYQVVGFHTPEEIYDMSDLSWKDKTRCVMGIAELRVEQGEALRNCFPPTGDCTKLVRTEGGWIRPMCSQRPSLAAKLKRTKKIVVLDRLEFEKESNVVHCRDCTLRYSSEYEKNQMRIWNALPKIFHLAKSWEDLLLGRVE